MAGPVEIGDFMPALSFPSIIDHMKGGIEWSYFPISCPLESVAITYSPFFLSLSLCFFPFLPFCLGLPCLGCAAADHVPMATANLHWNQGDNPFPCFYSSDPFLLFPSTFRSSPLLSFVTEALGLSRASAPANIRVAAASEQVGT